jgi:VIT1/CCC1 family predicted Fe2+/Mn2+ transporter
MASTSNHHEAHFGGTPTLRDAVIGLSDGLTVPFALAAGLSAVASTHIVVTAGMAEIVAGAISMGLGGYLAGRTDIEHYASERSREIREVRDVPAEEEAEVRQIFERYGLAPKEIDPIVDRLRARPEAWVEFMMRFELGLEEPRPGRARMSALTIGGSYAVGGLVPLVPYMLLSTARIAMLWSVVITLVALFAFGLIKGKVASGRPWRSALQAMLIGGLAAGTAFALARLIT